MINIELPYPPSVNTYWRSVPMGKRGVRVLISKRGRDYRHDVGMVCASEKIAGMRLGGRLAVKITLCAPDKRTRDMDNFNKALLDALSEAQVWGDDSQIDDLRVVRGPKVKGGKALVEVKLKIANGDGAQCQEKAAAIVRQAEEV